MEKFREAKRLQQERQMKLEQLKKNQTDTFLFQTPLTQVRSVEQSTGIRTFDNPSFNIENSDSDVDYSRIPVPVSTQNQLQFSNSYKFRTQGAEDFGGTGKTYEGNFSEESHRGGGDQLTLGEDGEFRLKSELSQYLYDHQEEGVAWMWKLWQMKKGGVLGDDMGLGKTLQCCAFLTGMIKCKLIRRAIVVVPPTLLDTWRKEFYQCDQGFTEYTSDLSKPAREQALGRVFRQRCILLTTYGMVQNNAADLTMVHGFQRFEEDGEDGSLWDIMILDEGHKIKNPATSTHKNLVAIGALVKIVITGTPIQNNLMEFYTLFSFCQPDMLGARKWFKSYYADVIEEGYDKCAGDWSKTQAEFRQKDFMDKIGPFFLRREKKRVSFDGQGGSSSLSKSRLITNSKKQTEKTNIKRMAPLGQKTDLIVWLKLKPIQRTVYKLFLNSSAVKAALNATGKPLPALTVLKKICDHPALVSKCATNMVMATTKKLINAANVEEIEDNSYYSDADSEWEAELEDEVKTPGKEAKLCRDQLLEEMEVYSQQQVEQMLMDQIKSHGIDCSCKTTFVLELLQMLISGGHRSLIFSQSKVMLNILQEAIQAKKYSYVRIDGDISVTKRTNIVRQFQEDDTISVMLLTSQVGGLGLTLTGADRVIIVDPSWNPSIDSQVIDRAYRIGQDKDVVVYRLITSGTIEEKIFMRQVFKGAIVRAGTGKDVEHRYFSQQEIRAFFEVNESEFDECATAIQLNHFHGNQSKIYQYPELADHVQKVIQTRDVLDISEHNLLYELSQNKNQNPNNQQQQKASSDEEELRTRFEKSLKFDKQLSLPDQNLNNVEKTDDLGFQFALELPLPDDTPIKQQQQDLQKQFQDESLPSEQFNTFMPQTQQQGFQKKQFSSQNIDFFMQQPTQQQQQNLGQMQKDQFLPQPPKQVLQQQFLKQQDQQQKWRQDVNLFGQFHSEMLVKNHSQALAKAEEEMLKYQNFCNNTEFLNKLPDQGENLRKELRERTEKFNQLQSQNFALNNLDQCYDEKKRLSM